MASSIFITCSLHNRNQKERRHTICTALKPSCPIHIQKPLFLYSNLRSISELHLSLKPVHLPLNYSQFPIFQKPNSTESTISCSLSPLKKLSTFCAEKLVLFLIGSFVFMSCLSTRPVFALPAQQSTYSESWEEDDEDVYDKFLKDNPRNVEVLKVVLHEKMRKGNTKEAVLYVERLIDIQPGEMEWRLLQALCYEMSGQLSKSKRLFKEILAKKPLLLRALHGLAMVMHKNHEGPAVFEMLYKALEVARRRKKVTEERNIRILIAQMHVVQGALEEGLKSFQILVDENPRDFRLYLCQGIIYSLLDKKKEAQEQFEIYQSLAPEEFPQRRFLDDVVVAAKSSSQQQLEKEFRDEYSYKN